MKQRAIRTAWHCLAAIALLLPQAALQAADKTPPDSLVVGLVPNVTARTLIAAFQPLREYLAQKLNQPVEVYTSPDFSTFYQQTQRGEFDLVVTPAHFAWLAIREAKYEPLVTYREPLQGLVVVKSGNSIDSPRALRGKKVGITDPLAIVTMRGLQWFSEHGMQAGTDFVVRKSSPHNTAALAVGNGDLDAAIIGSGPYRIMPEEIRSQIAVLAEVGAVPNAIYLANGNMSPQRRRALQEALLSFGNDSAEGHRFMEQYRYGGFKPITRSELKPMEAYSQRVKELLSGQ